MDIAELLAERGHLLLTAGGKGRIQQLTDLALQSGNHIAVAGHGHPLLADLTVAENIALPAMYHRNLAPEGVMARLEPTARSLGLEKAMELKPANLDRSASLRAKILRCLARDCGVLLMPFPPPSEARAASRALAEHGGGVRLWVACLARDAGAYADLGLAPAPLGDA